jgi:hypothetical protein
VATSDAVRARIAQIIDGLIERTETGQLSWERAAPPDAYAVSVGDIRFRIRSVQANNHAPFVLEFLGDVTLPELNSQDPDNPGMPERLARLYAAASASSVARSLASLETVAAELGLPPE